MPRYETYHSRKEKGLCVECGTRQATKKPPPYTKLYSTTCILCKKEVRRRQKLKNAFKKYTDNYLVFDSECIRCEYYPQDKRYIKHGLCMYCGIVANYDGTLCQEKN